MIHAQTGEINGTVSDQDGIPLPGVSVVVKNTTTGTTTDFDGNFNLENVETGTTVVFAFMGFASQEVVIQNFESLSLCISSHMAIELSNMQNHNINVQHELGRAHYYD